MKSVATFLMFTGQAEEAVNFYVNLFEDGVILNSKTLSEAESGAPSPSKHITFSLNGQQFIAFDSPVPHGFGFTPSISFFITCPNKEEVDRVFNALAEGGSTLMPLGEYPFSARYGWCNDRFGVSWQISLAR